MFKIDVISHAQLTCQMLTWQTKYLYQRIHFSKIWHSKRMGPGRANGTAFDMNLKIGGSHSQNICSWVENRCCCLRTVDHPNNNSTNKHIYEIANAWPCSLNCRAFDIDPKVVEFESALGRNIFCFKNVDTSFVELNADAHAQFIVQMLNLQ